MEIRVTVDSTRAQAALQRAPGVLEHHLDGAVFRAALEVARAARKAAPKAFTTLALSINTRRAGPAHYQVATGTNYARAVEEGTRPHFPPPANLVPWVKRVLGKSGDEAEDTAFLISRAIGRRGTRAQPYMAPAVDASRSRCVQLIEQGVAAGLAEAFKA